MFVEIFMDLVIVYYIHNGNSSEETQFISFRYVKKFPSVLTGYAKKGFRNFSILLKSTKAEVMHQCPLPFLWSSSL